MEESPEGSPFAASNSSKDRSIRHRASPGGKTTIQETCGVIVQKDQNLFVTTTSKTNSDYVVVGQAKTKRNHHTIGSLWTMATNNCYGACHIRIFTSQVVLCQIPILVLVVVASLDNADKQLLASSFAVLEETLQLNVEWLGYFSMFTNLSYALSLPMWGYLLHRYGIQRIHILLSVACASWGMATIGIAMSGSSIFFQALFRALVGVALGSILPLSQTLLVEMVHESMRGRAFGWMGLCEKLAGTVAAASIIYLEDNWQYPYYGLGFLSIVMAVLAWQYLNPQTVLLARNTSSLKSKQHDDDISHKPSDTDYVESELTLPQIIQRIAKIPAFGCLVAQGVFGGTPWDMMSFMLLLLDWRGFTKEQIISIQFTSGLSGTLGGWLGGMLGDIADLRFSGLQGRIIIGFVSVVGGIPCWGMFLYASDYTWALLWINLFHVIASWTPAGALRPICASLTRNPSERAQIVSMWIVLEKASGALFGAPLVGYLTSRMLPQDQWQETGVSQEKAGALAWNLFALSSFFWMLCAFFWLLMAWTMPSQSSINEKSKSVGSPEQQQQQKLHHQQLAGQVELMDPLV